MNTQFKRVTASGVIGLGLIFAGCSFSVGNLHTLTGQDKIVVQGARPELPPPPPPPKPKPKRKAKVVDKKIEITEKVLFEIDKSVIREASYELLNDVAAVMQENPHVQLVRIEGHTDSDGAAAYNKKLSQQRAESVMNFLVDAGIDASRMEAVGYGLEKPVADNSTAAGKEKNRRVEFNIVKQGKKEAASDDTDEAADEQEAE